MRKIDKTAEPAELVSYKKINSGATYYSISGELREIIRKACTSEQFYICAYCCKEIDGTNKTTINEHIIPQDKEPDKSLNFHNIVASCKTKNQCDSAHENKILELTPLDPDCESEICFDFNGKIKGNTIRAQNTINTLNLNNKKLVEARKRAIINFINSEGEGEVKMKLKLSKLSIVVKKYGRF